MKNKINRAQFVKQLAARLNTSFAESKHLVDDILGFIHKSLVKKERIEIRGIGSFKLVKHLPRKVVTPKGKRTIAVAKVVPRFKASTEILNRLNQQKDLDE